MFTAEQGKLLNNECAVAFRSAWAKVRLSNPDIHAQFVMSNCRVALRYLQYIHMLGIDGYPPIAVSLFRTYYEIVCSTMYLAENKGELADFLSFGRLMYYEIGQNQKLQGKTLNQLVPDHKALRKHFLEKRKLRGGNLLSWHGMTIEDLGKAVGMEKYYDQQIVRSQYTIASKLVHGDSLLALLAYNLDDTGIQPVPFAKSMDVFTFQAVAPPFPMFIALLASVDCGLMVGFTSELDRLNEVWRGVMKSAFEIDVDEWMKNNFDPGAPR
ncbi:MAG TPA: DUF5677 domain-containing protein [Candidatus Limnocylindrales bacterium]|nr:DUF5677 domain-containing protein [Candidatus Limnocylindrales bacterium]